MYPNNPPSGVNNLLANFQQAQNKALSAIGLHPTIPLTSPSVLPHLNTHTPTQNYPPPYHAPTVTNNYGSGNAPFSQSHTIHTNAGTALSVNPQAKVKSQPRPQQSTQPPTYTTHNNTHTQPTYTRPTTTIPQTI